MNTVSLKGMLQVAQIRDFILKIVENQFHYAEWIGSYENNKRTYVFDLEDVDFSSFTLITDKLYDESRMIYVLATDKCYNEVVYEFNDFNIKIVY